MITDCFDDKTEPVISLRDFYGEQKHLIETCLILFSQKIYQHLLDTFPSEKIGLIGACNGNIPIPFSNDLPRWKNAAEPAADHRSDRRL